MWFSFKSYTNINFTYGSPHVVFRMWSSVCGVDMCPYVESTWGVHMLFSSMIIYGTVYDHIRKPHVELPSVCGVHMWDFPYVESTCGPFFPCDVISYISLLVTRFGFRPSGRTPSSRLLF